MTVTREPADRSAPDAGRDRVDSTEVDGTDIDGTDIDGAQVDGTQLDGTQVDGTQVDATERAALEAAATHARGDARRAARAVRLARGARARAIAPAAAAVTATATDAAVRKRVSLAKAVGATAPATVEAEDVAPATDPSTDPDPATATATATADVAVAALAVVEDDVGADDHADDADDDAVDATNEGGDDRPARVRRRPRRVTVLATVFAVLAAAFVVVALVVSVYARDTATTSPAAARDAALLAARQDIVVLNTLDYTDVDGGLQRWLAATTGTLHDQLAQVSDADRSAIAASKSVTTAAVLAAAVTQVDATRGSATVIASVQIDVKPTSGTASTKRTRFSLTMAKVGAVWKIGGVQQVPVTLT